MAAPRKQDFCPRCYLDKGEDVILAYRLGSTQPLRCDKDHIYEDREELSNLTHQMNEQRRALAPKADPPPPVIEEAPGTPSKIDGDITNPVGITGLSIDGVKPLTIPPIDMARLSSILGTFRDSSTLFGSVYALQQELKDTKELLKRAMDAKAVAKTGDAPRKIGGDIMIQVIIPERHVEPVRDIAEANGMDITRYMNAKIEEGFDSMWYY
jgi:hypothetical protein